MVKTECVWTPPSLFYDEHIEERKGPKTWLLLLHSAMILHETITFEWLYNIYITGPHR